MAEDSDGNDNLTAVVICEGDYHDPTFPQKLNKLVARLNSLIDEQPKSKRLKVNKVEPWNSVRVTLSIPKEAATKLRQLAAEGNSALRELGILSVQLEGDTVISLRLVDREIVLRTTSTDNSSSQQSAEGLGELTRILTQNKQQPAPTASTNSLDTAIPSTSTSSVSSNILQTSSVEALHNGPTDKNLFKSPNTICPMDGKLPVPVPNAMDSACEYPFESMTQARVIHRRENTMGMNQQQQQHANSQHFIAPTTPVGQPPPPPYPNKISPSPQQQQQQNATGTSQIQSQPGIGGGNNNIAISSPLLVNLLQNEVGNNNNNLNSAPNVQSAAVASPSSSVTNLIANNTIADLQQHASLVNMNKCVNVNNKIPVQHTIVQQQSIVLNQQGSTQMLNQAGNICKTLINNNTQQLVNNASTTILNPSISVPSHSVINNKIQSQQQSIVTRLIGPSVQQQQQQQQQNLNIRNITPIQQTVVPRPPPTQLQSAQIQMHQFRPPITSAAGQPQQQQPQQSPHNMQAQFVTQQNSLPSSLQAESSTSFYDPIKVLNKPMDSATKSSYQEFARYQMQYNLSQQQQQQQNQQIKADGIQAVPQQNATLASSQANLQQMHNKAEPKQSQNNSDPLGLNLTDLPDLNLTKNELDSLLPTLNPSELECALFDSKFESLLDGGGKDLDYEFSSQNHATGIAKPESTTSNVPPTSNQNVQSSIGSFPSEEKKRPLLINPLTGDLEPMASDHDSGSENDSEESKSKKLLLKQIGDVMTSDLSNSLYSDDETSCSTGFSKGASDLSDGEKSNSIDMQNAKVRKPRKEKIAKDGVVKATRKPKDKTLKPPKEKVPKTKAGNPGKQRKNSTLPVVSEQIVEGTDKVKLVLKLSKMETKMDLKQTVVSNFNNQHLSQQTKNIQIVAQSNQPILTSQSTAGSQISLHNAVSQAQSITTSIANQQISLIQTSSSPGNEELRVPPLHISLRGRNSVVINNRKDRKKSTSGGEEDDLSRKATKRSMISNEHQISLIEQKELALTNNIVEKQQQGDIPLSARIKNLTDPQQIMSSLANYNVTISTSSGNQSTLENHKDKLLAELGNHKNLNAENNAGNKYSNSSSKTISLNDISTSNHVGSVTTVVFGDGTTKKNISELTNGLITLESKKRRLSGTAISEAKNNQNNEIQQIHYATISTTTIGSTNVGTLPQHSNLSSSKNLKGLNSTTTNNASCGVGGGQNRINRQFAAKLSSQPVKIINLVDLGNMTSSSNTQSLSVASTTTSATVPTSNVAATTVSNNTSGVMQLPQENSDTISEEKFKQKFLESTTQHTNNNVAQNVILQSNMQQKSAKDILHSHDAISKITQPVTEQNLDRTVDIKKDIDSGTLSKEQLSENQGNVNSSLNPTNNNNINNNNNNNNSTSHQESPNTQTQTGEDSGIESMDALSEKSPHQTSHSPPGVKRSISPKDDNHASDNKSKVEIGEIEAALAEMEGSGVEELIKNCDSKERINGDYAEADNISDAIRSLDESKELMMMSEANIISEIKSEFKSEKMEESSMLDDETENCKRSEMMHQCTDDKEEAKHEDNQSLEPKPLRTNPPLYTYSAADKVQRDITGTTSNENETLLKTEKKNDMLQLLSIEIPQHGDSENRIRTRASSKLESPLEINRQSPPDTPSLKSLQKGLTAERLSPKQALPGKNKRKRQGSESSTQSCVSDDTNSQRKKVRKSGGGNISQEEVQALPKQSGKKQENLKVNCTTNKKPEESSDSDEPLSDVKVRNTRVTKSQTTSPTLAEEKVLRNHKVLTVNTMSNATNSKSINTSPTTPSITITPVVQNALSQSQQTSGKHNAAKAPSEEKIGTRRSVRMTTSSLASNKANVKVSSLNSATTSLSVSAQSVAHGNNTHSKADLQEARRKTRSAGLEGQSESRRRRGSRDSK